MQSLILSEAGDDLEVVISAEAMRGQPEQVLLIVEVRIPSRGGWPNLGGSSVVLHRGERSVETQLTDAFGKAIFSGISYEELDQLNFEINPFRL